MGRGVKFEDIKIISAVYKRAKTEYFINFLSFAKHIFRLSEGTLRRVPINIKFHMKITRRDFCNIHCETQSHISLSKYKICRKVEKSISK